MDNSLRGYRIAQFSWLLLALVLAGASGCAARRSDDQVLDTFVQAHQDWERAAPLLGPQAVFDDVPVSEEEAERRQTDYFLRSPELKIERVLPGEPDGKGNQKQVPGRFTLVTRGNASCPPLRIKSDGKVEPPSQRFMNNPDLVVEVRDGKIYGVRAELHAGK